MDTPAWIVQIYSTTDEHTQALLGILLRGRDGLTVATDQNGADYFVIAECDNDDRAWWLYEFVMSIDVDAVLLHTTSGSFAPAEPHDPFEFV